MAIEEFGLAKEEWFTELLGLEHGIPSHDTFGEVYAAIDTEQFSDCFSRWVADLASITQGEVLKTQLGQGVEESGHPYGQRVGATKQFGVRAG